MDNCKTMESLVGHIAGMLNDEDFDLCTEAEYGAIVDDLSGPVREVYAGGHDGRFHYGTTLANVEVVDPLPTAVYRLYPGARRVTASGDPRPSIVLRGTPVDVQEVVTAVLSRMIARPEETKRYLERHGARREQIRDPQASLRHFAAHGSL